LAIAGSKLGNPQEPNTLHPFIQTITYSPLKKRTLNSPRDQSRLIGFSPDGKNIITELRQYQLLSGFHKLDFWGEDKGSGGNNYSINRSLNLNAAESEGYAFSQDGKTFRTVADERNTQTNEIIKLEVQEVDSISGRLLKSHLKVNAGVYALSPDGKWLAAIEKENTVVVYDVDRAVKISSYTIPRDVKVPVVPEDFDVKNPDWNPRLHQHASMVFSLDGHRLAVCRGIGARLSFQRTPTETAYGELLLSGGTGQTVVLNPETGKPLPSLEEADCLYPSYSLGQNSFSKDGRLFVVSGTRYDIKKQSILRTKDPKREFLMLQNPVSVITIWDTQTGKVLKSWENWHPYVAFNPVCPLLAVVEPNGMQTRIGFWDFSADAADKK
jgi:WD40 repeat protein